MDSELKGKLKKRGFRRFLMSFKYSYDGLKYAYLNEQSMFIHFLVTITVITLGLIFKITYLEWVMTFIIIGVVMATELINTAIEAVVDLVSPEKHPLAKVAKDTASAAVLIYSLVAFITGILIFGRYFIDIIA